jgi:hypothetical protein
MFNEIIDIFLTRIIKFGENKFLFTGDAEMISNKNTKVTTVIPKEVYKKLIEEASYEDRSVSNMIAKILKDRYNVKDDE